MGVMHSKKNQSCSPRGSSSTNSSSHSQCSVRDFQDDHITNFPHIPIPLIKGNFFDVYKINKTIGKGSYGKVSQVSLLANPDAHFAMKCIPKPHLTRETTRLDTELRVLQNVEHPNIVRLFEVYRDTDNYYLIMELCTGGDLLSKMMKGHIYTEQEVCKIMRKAFSAILNLHKSGIAHRDLKLENFLFTSNDENAELKLIDFGLSKIFGEDYLEKMRSRVGTLQYSAPEVLKGDYDEKCDIWSLGVIMYMLLSGEAPFNHKGHLSDYNKELLNFNITFKSKIWKKISPGAKRLIKALLKVNPEHRPYASEVLADPWFSKMEQGHAKNDMVLRDFSLNLKLGQKKIKKEVVKVMMNFLHDDQIAKLNSSFKFFDRYETGFIEIDEFIEAMKDLGKNVEENEVLEYIQDLSPGEDKTSINYMEFVTAIFHAEELFSDEELRKVFKYLDCDDSGLITLENLKDHFAKTGRFVSNQDLGDMIKEADVGEKGGISFEEFLNLVNDCQCKA